MVGVSSLWEKHMAIRELKSGGKTSMGCFVCLCTPHFPLTLTGHGRPSWGLECREDWAEVRALSLTPQSWRELSDLSSFTIIVAIVVLFDTEPHVVQACLKLPISQE